MIVSRVKLALSALVFLAACSTVPPPPPVHKGFTAEQIAVLRERGFEQVGDQWEFGMADRFLFATEESRLLPPQKNAIAQTASALAKVDIVGARVEGHTDATGTVAYNDALSARRATAVAAALAQGGMHRDRLIAKGLGSRHPVETNGTSSGRRENRRVVIIVAPDP
jgi:outer membrane protein OmpA-like peptidoglycan-associated protein